MAKHQLATLLTGLWLGAEVLVLFWQQKLLGNALPLSINMFTGKPEMAYVYTGSILWPTLLLLCGITFVGWMLQQLATIVATRLLPYAAVFATLIFAVGVYLPIVGLGFEAFAFGAVGFGILWIRALTVLLILLLVWRGLQPVFQH
ncbi:MAG: hypothetical protein LKG24_03020 [Lacticaseibacillus songhuajiangensis]|jgi:hypothetical protein|nr:hypothetical protein [Lacticaseibacillus songhuajiangensis]